MPSNEERRQAAREKLAKQNERREAQARKRKITIGAISATVVVALVAAGCYIWLPQGPRAPLRVGAADRFNSLHTNCTFPDAPNRVDQVKQALEASRTQPDEIEKQIAEANKTLSTMPAEQRKAIEAQIPVAQRTADALRQDLPQLEKQVADVQKLVDGKNKSVSKPDGQGVPNTGLVAGTITTNQGAMGFELDRSKAPCNVDTFVTLAQARYFDATVCHRETNQVAADKKSGLFVLQCGDPSASGVGGPSWTSPDEAPTFLKPSNEASQTASGQNVVYPAGTIAIANSNQEANPQSGQAGTSNTGSSQFFLVYQDTTLPANYSVIGKLDDAGLTTLKAIAAKALKRGIGKPAATPDSPLTDGQPAQPVNITSVTLSA